MTGKAVHRRRRYYQCPHLRASPACDLFPLPVSTWYDISTLVSGTLVIPNVYGFYDAVTLQHRHYQLRIGPTQLVL